MSAQGDADERMINIHHLLLLLLLRRQEHILFKNAFHLFCFARQRLSQHGYHHAVESANEQKTVN